MSSSSEFAPYGLIAIPESYRVGIRLEQIFMPHAHRRRLAVFAKQSVEKAREPPPLRFVHYTSAESALKIINTKRIWMRNVSCMADYSEVQHGYRLLNEFVSHEQRWGAFAEALDECAPGAAKKALDSFVPWTNSVLPQAIQYNTYIASVSEHDVAEDQHGRLSMWRGFGRDDTRVALVLKVPFFSGAAEALSLIFSPVAYLTREKVLALVDEIVGNVRANKAFLSALGEPVIINTVFRMLLAGVTCLKHEGFGEELEWRAIYTPAMFNSSLMQSSTRVIGGVPQLVYELPFDERVSPLVASLDVANVFDRIIIGPSPYPFAIATAFAEALGRAGIPQERRTIVTSGIPIRSY